MLILGPQERSGTSPLSGRTLGEVIDHEAATTTFAPNLDDLMLSLDPGAAAPGRLIDTRSPTAAALLDRPAADWRIPHFIHLLDSLCTEASPTPAVENPTFAGALNINTVRLPMLADVLPVVDEEARRRLAAIMGDRLGDYDAATDDGRSQPGGGVTPPEPGISAVLDCPPREQRGVLCNDPALLQR